MLDAYTYTIGLLGLVLLLLPIVPGIGQTINGARLWVQIGPLGFQPAEIGKVLIVIFLASYLTQKRELLQVATSRIGPLRLPPAKHLGPVLLAWGASLAILFLQRDLGASLLYFGIFVVMLWVATGRAAYLVIGLILFVDRRVRGVAAVRPRPAPRRHLAPRARPGRRSSTRASGSSRRRSSGWRAAVSSAPASARARPA